jgi:hypothetical protein
MNEIKKAHRYEDCDKIQLTDYAKCLVDKNSKRKRSGLTGYAEYLLNKTCNNKI